MKDALWWTEGLTLKTPALEFRYGGQITFSYQLCW